MKNNLNKNIQVIKTRKYKDINLYLRFSIPNKALARESIILLSEMMCNSSIKYNSKASMQRQKDMLYGLQMDASGRCQSNVCTLSVDYSFINPKFLKAKIDDYCDFIYETLNNPLITASTLKEAKRTIIEAISRKKDKPQIKAKQRLYEILGNDNPDFKDYCVGKEYISNIKKVKLDDVVKVHKYLLSKGQLHLYLCGDLSSKDIAKLTDYNFSNRLKICYKASKGNYVVKKDQIDKFESGQSILTMLYSSSLRKSSKDYFAWFLGNAIFGALPISLLFSQIREKMSLCYQISSYDYKNYGLTLVSTYIDADKKDVVVKEIEKQRQRIVDGDYDDQIFEMSKTVICNSIMSIYDDIDAYVDYLYESVLSNFNYSIEEYRDNIMKVSKADVSKAIKKYKFYFVHMMKGNKNGKAL